METGESLTPFVENTNTTVFGDSHSDGETWDIFDSFELWSDGTYISMYICIRLNNCNY